MHRGEWPDSAASASCADGRNIDVIMMTSAADALTVQTALRYGVVDYLIKPFQLSRFEEALRTWRNKRDA